MIREHRLTRCFCGLKRFWRAVTKIMNWWLRSLDPLDCELSWSFPAVSYSIGASSHLIDRGALVAILHLMLLFKCAGIAQGVFGRRYGPPSREGSTPITTIRIRTAYLILATRYGVLFLRPKCRRRSRPRTSCPASAKLKVRSMIACTFRKYLDFKVSGPGGRLLWKRFRPDRVNHLIVQRECTSVCWASDC